ncbi:MAG: hypothetical protein KDE53_40260 [Caldilineaceae bacterium]|nr:hypothetical protein [Caldilineaceae bacterium]
MKQIDNLSRDGPTWYRITIQGRLDPQWSAWFDGLTIRCDGDGRTVLEGSIADQPALHGVIKKIRNLGLPLLTVTPVDGDETA